MKLQLIPHCNTCILFTDVSVSFTEVSEPFLIVNTTVDLVLDVTLFNDAPAAQYNDIRAVTPPNSNFDLTVYLTDVDLSIAATQSTGFNISNSLQLTSSNLSSEALLAQSSLILSGSTVSIVVPASTTCNMLAFLCLQVHETQTSSYIDTNSSNNIFCKNVQSRISCFPGKYIINFNYFITLCIVIIF